MDVSTVGRATVAVAPTIGTSSVGAGDGVAVRVVPDVMVIAPIGAGGEAPARAAPAIASTANERTACLLIIALAPASECPKLIGGASRAPPVAFRSAH